MVSAIVGNGRSPGSARKLAGPLLLGAREGEERLGRDPHVPGEVDEGVIAGPDAPLLALQDADRVDRQQELVGRRPELGLLRDEVVAGLAHGAVSDPGGVAGGSPETTSLVGRWRRCAETRSPFSQRAAV